MNYNVDTKTGLLPAEYVDVYGIPFSLIPFKGRPKDEKTESIEIAAAASDGTGRWQPIDVAGQRSNQRSRSR